jgi:hypothetical protein
MSAAPPRHRRALSTVWTFFLLLSGAAAPGARRVHRKICSIMTRAGRLVELLLQNPAKTGEKSDA